MATNTNTTNEVGGKTGGGIGSKIKFVYSVVKFIQRIGDNIRGTAMGATDTVAKSSTGEAKNEQLVAKGQAELAEGIARIKGQPVHAGGTSLGAGAQGTGPQNTSAHPTGAGPVAGYGGAGAEAGSTGAAQAARAGVPGSSQNGSSAAGYGADSSTVPTIGTTDQSSRLGQMSGAQGGLQSSHPTDGQAPGQGGSSEDPYVQKGYELTRQGGPGVADAQTGRHGDQDIKNAYSQARQGSQTQNQGADLAGGGSGAAAGATQSHQNGGIRAAQNDPSPTSDAQVGRHPDPSIRDAYASTRQGDQTAHRQTQQPHPQNDAGEQAGTEQMGLYSGHDQQDPNKQPQNDSRVYGAHGTAEGQSNLIGQGADAAQGPGSSVQ
ncbi:hypothetical protein HYDPIDRAFT_170532 [Hydnomerulius pinastri MD-312]|uniref:Uncharacterized protein n=1 Tax=Hydnomerulius pinastri MD-312 TaxID=994086 RepID=A0A0C9W209_9AGAM|nr:hypothetical protein HYDPIDRAFT_170532 [Hydnomerulius pinastri MD-312]